jgi:hypothetical protein
MEPESAPPETGRNGTTPVLDYSRRSLSRPQTTFGRQIIWAAVIGTTAILVDAVDPYPRLPLLYGLLAWAMVVVTSVLRIWAGIMPELPEGPRWRLAVVVLFLLTFVVPVRVHHCDHATTYCSSTHIGISYSRTGGPCNNSPHCGGMHLIGNWYLAALR